MLYFGLKKENQNNYGMWHVQFIDIAHSQFCRAQKMETTFRGNTPTVFWYIFN